METVLVTGYAKAPQGTSMYEEFKTAGVILEIDIKTHRIVSADATFITPLARDFFNRMLAGMLVTQDLRQIERTIKRHYLAVSQQAVLTAIRVAIQRYLDYQMDHTKHGETTSRTSASRLG